jgi:hypothetical protein
MHEYYDVEEYKKFLVVQAQAALFIVAYHGYLGVQSIWQCVLAVLIVAWTTNEITHVEPMIAGLVGLVLAIVCVHVVRIHHIKIHYHQVFYFLIQPALFYYIMRLYVEQTMYPVGIVLGFVVWLGMFLIAWGVTRHSIKFCIAVCVPVFSMFFFSWILNKFVWIPLSITAGITVVYLLAAASYAQTEKMSRQK